MQKNILIAAVSALSLAACSSIGTLQSTQPENQISGTVSRSLLEPHQVDVRLDGKSYRGEWRTDAPTAEQKAATPQPHRFHVGQVSTVLTADDGSKLNCRWQTHGETGAGSCSAGHREYPLTLK